MPLNVVGDKADGNEIEIGVDSRPFFIRKVKIPALDDGGKFPEIPSPRDRVPPD